MPSLWEPPQLDSIRSRLRRVPPTGKPNWGKLTPHAMICHLADGLRLSLGELTAEREKSIFSKPLVRWLVLNVVPIPKNAESRPVFFTTEPIDWEQDLRTLEELITRGAERPADELWGMSPLLGAMTKHQWGQLNYKHIDHHLRQFGC